MEHGLATAWGNTPEIDEGVLVVAVPNFGGWDTSSDGNTPCGVACYTYAVSGRDMLSTVNNTGTGEATDYAPANIVNA